jgi:hypothetical protein
MLRAPRRPFKQHIECRAHRHPEIVKVEAVTDRTVVTAHLAGDFPSSPVDLQYRFNVAGSKISVPEIG